MCRRFKSTVQTLSYLPHFISLVVVCSIICEFTASEGAVNQLVRLFGGEPKTMLLVPELFRTISWCR